MILQQNQCLRKTKSLILCLSFNLFPMSEMLCCQHIFNTTVAGPEDCIIPGGNHFRDVLKKVKRDSLLTMVPVQVSEKMVGYLLLLFDFCTAAKYCPRTHYLGYINIQRRRNSGGQLMCTVSKEESPN